MKHGKRRQYEGVLSIPEGRSGRFAIRHVTKPPGCLPIANARTAIIGGHETGNVHYDRETRWHQLHEKGVGTWMTDLPIEQAWHDRELARVRSGSVLVGGLGLGYAALILARRPRVTRAVVVEKSRHVIALVEPALRASLGALAPKLEVVHADLFEYLKARNEHRLRSGAYGYAGQTEFGWAFYDIWMSDGEGTFFDVVLPLIKGSLGVVKRQPICWNEDVMRGQLRFSIESQLAFKRLAPNDGPSIEELSTPMPAGPYAKWHNWFVPFFEWVRLTNPSDNSLITGAAFYSRFYGSWGWPACWSDFTEAGRSSQP